MSGEPDNCLDGQLDLKWEEKQILDVTKKTIPDDKGMKMEKKKCLLLNSPSVTGSTLKLKTKTLKIRTCLGKHRVGRFWTLHMVEIQFFLIPRHAAKGRDTQ